MSTMIANMMFNRIMAMTIKKITLKRTNGIRTTELKELADAMNSNIPPPVEIPTCKVLMKHCNGVAQNIPLS